MELLAELWGAVDVRRDLLLILTPLFIATLAAEWLKMRERGVYRLGDSLASLGLGGIYLLADALLVLVLVLSPLGWISHLLHLAF